MTIWSMGIACCLTKLTDTHSEYAIRIFSTAKMITRVRLGVTFIRTFPCYLYKTNTFLVLSRISVT
jgi:hypothetical protein